MQRIKLRKITEIQAKGMVSDPVLLKRILKKEEKVFVSERTKKRKDINSVLDIELSLYRCERVGFFKK